MNTTAIGTANLATGTADSSAVSEFYNATLGKDYLFVGVTNNCIATFGGGSAGCVMSLDITSGFPTVNASSTALAATGGTADISWTTRAVSPKLQAFTTRLRPARLWSKLRSPGYTEKSTAFRFPPAVQRVP